MHCYCDVTVLLTVYLIGYVRLLRAQAEYSPIDKDGYQQYNVEGER